MTQKTEQPKQKKKDFDKLAGNLRANLLRRKQVKKAKDLDEAQKKQ